MLRISKNLIAIGKDQDGQLTKKQFAALGVPWPPFPGWQQCVIGRPISKENVNAFLKASTSVDAHFVTLKDLKHFKQEKTVWVSWFKLLNKSTGMTLDELKAILIEKGLSDGYTPTLKAHELGFAKNDAGKSLWDRSKFIAMMQADRKVRKLISQGKRVHPLMLKRSLIGRQLIQEAE